MAAASRPRRKSNRLQTKLGEKAETLSKQLKLNLNLNANSKGNQPTWSLLHQHKPPNVGEADTRQSFSAEREERTEELPQ
ncbi:hypothetical protein OIU77_003023 [Salix suchowensis]|uniref:Uncharacterized protein n=1 Tax=Salix suchowensis TaxID=1278906 RepID=A0ABQ9AY63_9ROSI|nr:hypothetical protein OIU77_003023 [Salix suchowensis]